MGKQKFYAVAAGKRPGIYYSWEECRAQVEGISGAAYKSFPTLKEAAAYLAAFDGPEDADLKDHAPDKGEVNALIDGRINALGDDEVIAFVDGSYDAENECSGYGAILLFSDGTREELFRHFDKGYSEDFIALRNVAAELEGVKAAVERGISAGRKKITVFYDYTGIENWARDTWKANKDITKAYKTFIAESEKKIEISFFKVDSHTGVTLNEEADALAKRAAGGQE
ncbi:MAG: ribonuclease H family protein [Lachnospiraceae bacterium]|nr:ribonuclease H family protein [Lachnospiraceae bacterium]